VGSRGSNPRVWKSFSQLSSMVEHEVVTLETVGQYHQLSLGPEQVLKLFGKLPVAQLAEHLTVMVLSFCYQRVGVSITPWEILKPR
jgi:hypothetical protein